MVATMLKTFSDAFAQEIPSFKHGCTSRFLLALHAPISVEFCRHFQTPGPVPPDIALLRFSEARDDDLMF